MQHSTTGLYLEWKTRLLFLHDIDSIIKYYKNILVRNMLYFLNVFFLFPQAKRLHFVKVISVKI